MKRLTLYHGTDARVIRMSNEERKAYVAGCNFVIDKLCHSFGILEPSRVKELGIELYTLLFMIQQRNKKSEFFQYNVLCLTNLYDRAMYYANHSFAGGEVGFLAYNLIKQCENRFPEKFKLYENIDVTINNIKKFAEEETRYPVIITINDIDTDYLVFESGCKIDDESIKVITEQTFETSFKYKKELDLNQYKIEYLTNQLTKN